MGEQPKQQHSSQGPYIREIPIIHEHLASPPQTTNQYRQHNDTGAGQQIPITREAVNHNYKNNQQNFAQHVQEPHMTGNQRTSQQQSCINQPQHVSNEHFRSASDSPNVRDIPIVRDTHTQE